MKIFANAAIYQFCWFFCVLGGNTGAFFAVGLLLLHLFFSPQRVADLKMMGVLLCVGLIVDGTLHQVGFISFTQTGVPVPLWLMVIWLALAITPHHCLAWLKNRSLLSALFGAFGGPVAYWAGTRLGAATFNWSLPASLGTLALVWALLWPLVMYVSVVADKKARQRLT